MNKLTIGITTYQRPDHLYNCLNSILRVNNRIIESIIVVNDSGKDLNKDEQEKYNEVYNQFSNKLPMVVIENKLNLGLPYSRNILIRSCKTNWFTFIDDDDVYHPQAFEFLNFSDEFDIICFFSGRVGRKNIFTIEEVIKSGITPPVGSQVYKTKFIKNYSYNTSIKSGVDHDLWFNMYGSNSKVLLQERSWVVPNRDESMQRITNSTSRRDKLIESFVHWRRVLPNDVFAYIEMEYRKYFDNTALIRFLKNGDYFEFMRSICSNPRRLYYLMSLLSKKILKRVNKFDKYE